MVPAYTIAVSNIYDLINGNVKSILVFFSIFICLFNFHCHQYIQSGNKTLKQYFFIDCLY